MLRDHTHGFIVVRLHYLYFQTFCKTWAKCRSLRLCNHWFSSRLCVNLGYLWSWDTGLYSMVLKDILLKGLDIIFGKLWNSLSQDHIFIRILLKLPLVVLINWNHSNGISVLDHSFSTGALSLANFHQWVLFALVQAYLIQFEYLEKSFVGNTSKLLLIKFEQ